MRKLISKNVIALSTTIVVLLALFAFSPYFVASQGTSTSGNLLIGELPSTVYASFVDDATGTPYEFLLIASEWDNRVTMQLGGPTITLCTANGSTADIDFGSPIPYTDPDPPPGIDDIYTNHYPGNSPLPDIQCGTAYEMAVEIDDSQSDIQFHGYVHSDYPLVTYMGMMTTNVKIKYGGDVEDYEIEIEVYTPKDEIKLKGIFTGNVEIDTGP